MPVNILFEVIPTDPSGNLVTVNMAHASAKPDSTLLDGKEWRPLISQRPTFTFEISDNNGDLTEAKIGRGTISFRVSDHYENEIWSKWIWSGAQARVWFGDFGAPFSDYKLYFTGEVSSLSRSGITASLDLLGPDAKLDKDLLSLTYKGTGGAEGPTDMEGTLKPWCSGDAENINSVLVDPARWIYQVHGYGPVLDIPVVYEFAQAKSSTYMVASVATFAELAALSLQPAQWAVCLPLGMFRLGGAPLKKITADVTGATDGASTPRTVDTIVPHLLKTAGVPANKIGDFSRFAGVTWDLYSESQISIGDAVRSAMTQAGGYLIADEAGVWQCGDFYAQKTPTALNSDRSTFPLVRAGEISEPDVADPVWKVEVGYRRCWSTHSDDEISPALTEQLAANNDTIIQIKTDVTELKGAVDAVTGVNLYPVMVKIDGLAEIGQRALNANDKAAQAYRNEAFTYVDDLRQEVLADGTDQQTAIVNLGVMVAANAAAIQTETTIRANADQSAANTLTILGTKSDTNAASIVTEHDLRTTALSAVATKFSEMEAEVAGVRAGITDETTARVSASAAEVVARGQQIASLNTSLTSAIQSEASTRATADNVLTTTVNQVSARANDAHARITNEQIASVNRDTANASSISTVQSSLNGTNSTLAIVQSTATTTSNRLGVVEAGFGFSVGAGNVVGGMKALANSGGISKIIFDFGSIAFRNNQNGAVSDIVEIAGGQMRIPNTLIGVANILSANIQDLTIGTNKIAFNAITVTHYAERGAVMYGNNAHQEAISYTLYAPNDCDLIVMLSATQGFPSGDRLWEFGINCDGNPMTAIFGGQKTQDTPSRFAKLRVSAGYHTINSTWRGQDSSVRLAQLGLIILEARR
jgi:hypothetical protein